MVRFIMGAMIILGMAAATSAHGEIQRKIIVMKGQEAPIPVGEGEDPLLIVNLLGSGEGQGVGATLGNGVQVSISAEVTGGSERFFLWAPPSIPFTNVNIDTSFTEGVVEQVPFPFGADGIGFFGEIQAPAGSDFNKFPALFTSTTGTNVALKWNDMLTDDPDIDIFAPSMFNTLMFPESTISENRWSIITTKHSRTGEFNSRFGERLLLVDSNGESTDMAEIDISTAENDPLSQTVFIINDSTFSVVEGSMSSSASILSGTNISPFIVTRLELHTIIENDSGDPVSTMVSGITRAKIIRSDRTSVPKVRDLHCDIGEAPKPSMDGHAPRSRL